MVYINPARAFDEDGQRLVRIQIDNSLELGWEPQDIWLVTNFPFEYGGVRATVLADEMFCSWWPPVSKINVIVELFKKGLIGDELYWFHDLDAFQQEKFSEEDVNLGNYDLGTCNYGRMPMWATGTIFFKKSARDIFELLQEICNRDHINEQRAMRQLVGYSWDDRDHKTEYWKRVKLMNISYNFNTCNIDSNYRQAEKPLKVIHFHLTPRFIPIFLQIQNRVHPILTNERFRKILAHYDIT